MLVTASSIARASSFTIHPRSPFCHVGEERRLLVIFMALSGQMRSHTSQPMHLSRSIVMAGSPSMPSRLLSQEMALTGHFTTHSPHDLHSPVKRVTRILSFSSVSG